MMMRGGALTMRLDGRYIPDPMAFINAAKETDPKLAFVRAPKEAMVLNGKWHSEADVLKVAIRMMKRICARLDEMKLAEKEEKTEGNAQ